MGPLHRSMDGCRTTSDMLAAGLAVYDELDGLNVPVPGGFQVYISRQQPLSEHSLPCMPSSCCISDCSAQFACCALAQNSLLLSYTPCRRLGSERLTFPHVQSLAKSLAEGLDIRFGSVAQKIEWDGAGKGARVTCENGDTFEADTVIVTVSLGVLKV